MANADTNAPRVRRRRSAGAFDIRNVIGALLGIYGIVLLISAAALDPGTDAAGVAKNPGYNVWAGVALVVVALVFLAWAKLRPVVVPDDTGAPEADAPPAGGR